MEGQRSFVWNAVEILQTFPRSVTLKKKIKREVETAKMEYTPQHTYRTLDVCRLHSLLTREMYVLTACLLSFTVFVFLLFCPSTGYIKLNDRFARYCRFPKVCKKNELTDRPRQC